MAREGIRRLAELLQESNDAWAFTGAGVSTPSGIPDFRGPDGLWRKYDPGKVSSIDAFQRDPKSFYEFWSYRFQVMAAAEPNVVHRFLAWLEERGMLRGVITQNIDGLHRRAGSKRVLEIHGRADRGICTACGRVYPLGELLKRMEGDGVPRCDCGGLIKPDVVLFGEEMPPIFSQALEEVKKADLFLVLGTSLLVWPAERLVPLAARHGATVAIINRDPTPYDGLAEVVIRDDLVIVIQELWELLKGEGDDRREDR